MTKTVNFNQISVHSSAEESPGFLLWRVSTLWRKAIETVLKPLGLTHPQFVVLATTAWLTRLGKRASQAEIGRQAALDPNTTSQILRGLQTKGLIERSHNFDEKSKYPVLIAAGVESLSKAMPAVENADTAFFASIDLQESKMIHALQILAGNKSLKTKKIASDRIENRKSHPLIVGVSGISGAGKSTLIKRLAETLQATPIFWDDYDEISQAPQDYVEWFHASKDYNDWVYPKLVDTLHQLKNSETIVCPATKRILTPTRYILFDAPLGYCHQATGKYIDFLICLDTPLDIALARRLIRDYQSNPNPQKMIQELENYLSNSRPLFILSSEEKISDLIVDGSLALKEQERQVLDALSLFEQKIK